MMTDTEVLDTLKNIGLNLYERKIFVALLAKGIATAAEASEIANVPRSRSYDVLESLAEKGFVIVQPSKPIKYVALKPSEAIDMIKENLKRKHNTMMERIDRLKVSPILEKLERIYDEGLMLMKPSEMTGTLKGSYIINRQMRSIFKNALKSIDIITTEQGLNNIYSKHYRLLKKAARNGVKIRILAPLGENSAVKSLSEFAELKNLESPIGRVCMIDNKHMLFALTDDNNVHETQDIIFWAESNHATESIMKPFFDHYWESGQ
jgi:sugar-specific transcriptional regulator TrmB